MDKKEVLSEKVRAILMRDKARDVYDFWFLLKNNSGFDIKLVNKKLRFHKTEFNYNDFFKALIRKKDLWRTDLKNLILIEPPKFDIVIKEIEDCLNK